ncbi:MAG: anti-phage dCTP deaminase, partial [Halomonas sp.]|uniref:anti-phage dCTP deaminase n=1 Tax=Halomonas sp. TaxID=1486246 RepID=UPI00286FC069
SRPTTPASPSTGPTSRMPTDTDLYRYLQNQGKAFMAMEGNVEQLTYSGVDPLKPVGCPELVFGIVSPVGSNKEDLCEALKEELGEYGYISHRIRLSELISLVPGFEDAGVGAPDEGERIKRLMIAGSSIRSSSGLNDALAMLGISEVLRIRAELNQQEECENPETRGRTKTAYILDSLKHPDEVSTLRAIYGSGFMLISAFSRRSERVSQLAQKIAYSKNDPQGVDAARSSAEELVKIDEKEEANRSGQNVQSCFPLGDFFVNLDAGASAYKEELERFLKVVFGCPFVTPTRDEWGMFHAESSSWRSADLARQVGAAITTPNGSVLALGCNEVAKPFGGLYWEGDDGDARDFQSGRDVGGEQKRLMVAEVFNRISESGEFDKSVRDKFSEMAGKAIAGDDHPILSGLQALNVIEYGRTVHAEMAAVSDAAMRGVSLDGAVMYVNTFPCHICARHIVSSGIERLVYVEPYPKSMTSSLFGDSIVVDGHGKSDDKVAFHSFSGIAPRLYMFAFKATMKRKSAGSVVSWSKRTASTRLKRFVTSYIVMEHQIVNKMLPKLMEDKE